MQLANFETARHILEPVLIADRHESLTAGDRGGQQELRRRGPREQEVLPARERA
jgi:hypothetical protein